MKKSILTLLVSLFSILLTVAAPVDEQVARKLAGDFLQGKMPATRGLNTKLTRAITGVADGPEAAVYVFNADNAFVIISGDDNTKPVLGYSDNGQFDADNAPEGLKELILYYQQEVKRFSNSTRGEAITIHDPVAPLVKTKWNQTAPYNSKCPMDSTTRQRSVTGCVATAVAQVLYYNQCPATGYAWDQMKYEYSKTDTGDAVDAVAKLMADVGASFEMEYSSKGSSANSSYASEVMRNEYGYSETTEFVYRDSYTAKEWDELIYNELKSSRPVLFSAYSISPAKGIGGHAFVIDGYDDKGYYHVNWGWGGLSDGYYLISVLNPDEQSTGGNSDSNGYSVGQFATIGIQPAATPLSKTARLAQYDLCILNKNNVRVAEATYKRASLNSDFTGVLFQTLVFNTNKPSKTRKYDIAFDLFKGDEYLGTLGLTEELSFEYIGGYYLDTRETDDSDGVAFGKGLADGTYQIRVRAKESNCDSIDWAICHRGLDYYIELTINGLTMTAKSHGLSYDDYVSDPIDIIVNSVTLGETKRQDKKMSMTFNVTNHTTVPNATLYLWGNGGERADSVVLLTGVGINVDPGETGNVEMTYTPQRGGSFTFYLSPNYEELTDTLYTFTTDVEGTSMADVNLAAEFTIQGTQQASGLWNIESTSIKGTLKLTNNGTELYDDVARLKLYYATKLSGTYPYATTLSLDARVPVGQSVTLPFQFDDLTVGYYYGFVLEVMEKGALKTLVDFKTAPRCKVLGDTGIHDIQLDEADAEVYDMNGVRKGKASNIKSLPKGLYIINKKKVINN